MNLYTPFLVYERKIKKENGEYFKDLSKTNILHAMAVPAKHRGNGLATLINRVAIDYSAKVGCKYLFAHMVSPETIHIARKSGYTQIDQLFYDEPLLRRFILGEENEGKEFTPVQLERIEVLK